MQRNLNYANPVRRDVVNASGNGEQMVIRWTTDNSGPWFLHCHIDWHLDAGFAVIMAESPSDTRAQLNLMPHDWDQLCPIFDSLSPSQLGGGVASPMKKQLTNTTEVSSESVMVQAMRRAHVSNRNLYVQNATTNQCHIAVYSIRRPPV
ncbi:Cupredoxin [Suillus clintonianus]|uniref:Cupredoxin n=1 Tax=Suillus clintonianus TaxID=1904413 RepID=UPI001B8807AC|nr:Cupredoxin [Suillus clintonianus]KAG2146323.1 Cupredoxin [Suillus clintonianus]